MRKTKNRKKEVDPCDLMGVTPLMHGAGHPGWLSYAVKACDVDAVKAMIGAGANVNATDKDGFTSLHKAAALAGSRAGELNDDAVEIVRLLLAAEAKVDPCDKSGSTPLIKGAGNPDCVRALVQAGADVNAVNLRDETPLSWAVIYRSAESVKLLIAAGSRVNIQKNLGGKHAWSPSLHSAANGWMPTREHVHACAEIVRILLDAGAIVDDHVRSYNDGINAILDEARLQKGVAITGNRSQPIAVSI